MREPRQLAGCVIQNELGHVLLLHRIRDDRFQWEMPGGKVEDETHKKAAGREAEEELGVKVEVGRQLGGTIFGHYGVYWEYTWFHAKIIEGEPKAMEPHNHDKLAYFDLSQMPPADVVYSPNVRDLVRDIEAGRIQL